MTLWGVGSYRPLVYTFSMSPMLQTKEPGIGSAVIHSPAAFFTCQQQSICSVTIHQLIQGIVQLRVVNVPEMRAEMSTLLKA